MGRVLYTTHMTVNAVSHRVHAYSFFRAIITGHNAVVWHLAGIHLALFLLFYYEIVQTQTFIYTLTIFNNSRACLDCASASHVNSSAANKWREMRLAATCPGCPRVVAQENNWVKAARHWRASGGR